MRRCRETVFTTFCVSDFGTLVQNARYGELALRWPDVRATYSRFGKMGVREACPTAGDNEL